MRRIFGCSEFVELLFESHRTVIAAFIILLAMNVAVSVIEFTYLWSDIQGSEREGHRESDHIPLS